MKINKKIEKILKKRIKLKRVLKKEKRATVVVPRTRKLLEKSRYFRRGEIE